MRTICINILLFAMVLVFTSCTSPKLNKSVENLNTAFKQESATAEKYGRYAQKATEEGYDSIAQLFIAFAKSEIIHASNCVKVLQKYGERIGVAETGNFEVKNTVENLQNAISGETYLVMTMYPGFIRASELEKAPDAAKAFTWALDSEKRHLSYFRQALTAINDSTRQGRLPYNWLICPTCGNIYNDGDVKEQCDFCLNKVENFVGYQAKPEEE